MAKLHLHPDRPGNYLCTDPDCEINQRAGSRYRLIKIVAVVVAAILGFAAAWSGWGLLVIAFLSLAVVPAVLEFTQHPRNPPP